MPLDNMKKRILDGAEESASKIRNEGASEAHRILSEAEAKSRQIEHQAQETANSEAERMTREHESAMEIEIKTMFAEAKGLQLDRTTEKVVAKVKEILEDKYLKQMLEEGIKQFGKIHSGDPVLITSEKNRKVAESLKKQLDVKYQDIEGFALKAKDGSIAMNVSADAVVMESIDDIRRIVSKNISGDAESLPNGGVTEEEML